MRDNTIAFGENGKETDGYSRREREVILIAALAACIMAFSALLLLAALLGQDIFSWDIANTVCIFFFMSGAIWGILILVNR